MNAQYDVLLCLLKKCTHIIDLNPCPFDPKWWFVTRVDVLSYNWNVLYLSQISWSHDWGHLDLDRKRGVAMILHKLLTDMKLKYTLLFKCLGSVKFKITITIFIQEEW